MKHEVRIILALSFSLAACGQSKPDVFLEQTTTALECASQSAPGCAGVDGGPGPGVDECYGDGACEYGEVCDRRHGASQCQPKNEDDGYGGHGGDDSSSDDSSSDDDGYGDDDSSSDDDGYGDGGDDLPDGGSAACDPDHAAGDPKAGSDDCAPDDKDSYEDRSGSNSGPH